MVMIRINSELRRYLKSKKVHPRQSYNEVLYHLLGINLTQKTINQLENVNLNIQDISGGLENINYDIHDLVVEEQKHGGSQEQG